MSLGATDPTRVSLNIRSAQSKQNITRESQRLNILARQQKQLRIQDEERRRREVESEKFTDPTLRKAAVPKNVKTALAQSKQEGGITTFKDRFYGTGAEKVALQALEKALDAEELASQIAEQKAKGHDTSNLEHRLSTTESQAQSLYQQALDTQRDYVAKKVGGMVASQASSSTPDLSNVLEYTRFVYEYTPEEKRKVSQATTGEDQFVDFASQFIDTEYNKYVAEQDYQRRRAENLKDTSSMAFRMEYRKLHGVDPIDVKVPDRTGKEVSLTSLGAIGLNPEEAGKFVADYEKAKEEQKKDINKQIKTAIDDYTKQLKDKGVIAGTLKGTYDEKTGQITVTGKNFRQTVEAQRDPTKFYTPQDWTNLKFTGDQKALDKVRGEAIGNVSEQLQKTGGGTVTQAAINQEMSRLLSTTYKEGIPVSQPAADYNQAFKQFSDQGNAVAKANQSLERASQGDFSVKLTTEEKKALGVQGLKDYNRELNKIRDFQAGKGKADDVIYTPKSGLLGRAGVYEGTDTFGFTQTMQIRTQPEKPIELASRFANINREFDTSVIDTEKIKAIEQNQPAPTIAESIDEWLKLSPNASNDEKYVKGLVGTALKTADEIALFFNTHFNQPKASEPSRQSRSGVQSVVDESKRIEYQPALSVARDVGYEYTVGEANPLDVPLLLSNPQKYFESFNISKEIKEKGAPIALQKYLEPETLGSLTAFGLISAIPIPGSGAVTKGITTGLKSTSKAISKGISTTFERATGETLRGLASKIESKLPGSPAFQRAYAYEEIQATRPESSIFRFYPNYEKAPELQNIARTFDQEALTRQGAILDDYVRITKAYERQPINRFVEEYRPKVVGQREPITIEEELGLVTFNPSKPQRLPTLGQIMKQFSTEVKASGAPIKQGGTAPYDYYRPQLGDIMKSNLWEPKDYDWIFKSQGEPSLLQPMLPFRENLFKRSLDWLYRSEGEPSLLQPYLQRGSLFKSSKPKVVNEFEELAKRNMREAKDLSKRLFVRRKGPKKALSEKEVSDLFEILEGSKEIGIVRDYLDRFDMGKLAGDLTDDTTKKTSKVKGKGPKPTPKPETSFTEKEAGSGQVVIVKLPKQKKIPAGEGIPPDDAVAMSNAIFENASGTSPSISAGIVELTRQRKKPEDVAQGLVQIVENATSYGFKGATGIEKVLAKKKKQEQNNSSIEFINQVTPESKRDQKPRTIASQFSDNTLLQGLQEKFGFDTRIKTRSKTETVERHKFDYELASLRAFVQRFRTDGGPGQPRIPGQPKIPRLDTPTLKQPPRSPPPVVRTQSRSPRGKQPKSERGKRGQRQFAVIDPLHAAIGDVADQITGGKFEDLSYERGFLVEAGNEKYGRPSKNQTVSDIDFSGYLPENPFEKRKGKRKK